jgi:3-oxoacyl-[acyl-carrier-protein] synthase II
VTRFAISGIGVVSPIGVGEAAFFRALDEQTSGIFADEEGRGYGFPLAARVGEFGARQALSPASLRRMPRLTQMTVVAAKEAMASAAGSWPDGRVGVVIGTGLGTLGETLEFVTGYVKEGVEAASPTVFPVSVMNAPAGQLAVELKLTGVNSTVNHRDHSALSAIGMACDFLELGRADAMLVGGIDELSGPMLHAYARLGGLSPTGTRPYDVARNGSVLGEATALLVIEREEDARARGAKIRAVITGRGETGEVRPRVGWGHAPSWPEAVRAVRTAVAGIDAERIGWVAGGGDGGGLDERELRAVSEALGRLPPTSSILAQTGASFSSSMLRVLAAIWALERQRIPATVGLTAPLPEFAASLPTEPRAATIDAVLVPSFAQGGANLALVLAS